MAIVHEWTGNGVYGIDPTWQTFNANIVYDNATHGRTVLRWDGTGSRFLAKSPLGLTDHAVAFDFYKTGNPTSSNPIISPQTASGGAVSYRVRLSSTGTLIVDNSSSTQVGVTSALANNTWYRVAYKVTATTFELRVINKATGVQYGATVSATSTFGDTDNFRIGQIGSSPNLPLFYIANLAINNDDVYIGTVPDGGAVVSPRVAIIGDSLVYASADAVTFTGEGPALAEAAFGARGVTADSIYLWGVGGKRISVADFTGRTSMVNYADAVTMLGTVDYAIIALGTNDRPQTDSTINTAIDTLLTAVGSGPHVIWVGLTSKQAASADDIRVNGLIQAKLTARGNATFADWNTHIRAIDGGANPSPYWQTADSTHMTHDGYVERFEYMASFIPESAVTTSGTATATATGTAVAVKVTPRTGTAAAAASGSATSASVRVTSGTATAGAAATAQASTVRAKTATAPATATGAGSTAGVKQSNGQAAAAGSATATVVTTRTTSGTAVAVASATAQSGEVRDSSGEAVATATASATVVTVRTVAATASAGTSASAAVSSVRTQTGEALSVASATGTIASIRTAAGAATAVGTASLLHTTIRALVGIAIAYATAAGRAPLPPIPNNRTLNVAAPTRTLGVQAPTRTLEWS